MSGSGTAIHGFFEEFLVLRQQSWDLSPGVFIVVVTVASLHHFSQHHKGLSQIHNNIFPPRGTLLNTDRCFLFVPSYVFFFNRDFLKDIDDVSLSRSFHISLRPSAGGHRSSNITVLVPSFFYWIQSRSLSCFVRQ